MFFLYQGFNIVYLFLSGVCATAYSEFIKLFLQRFFFTLSGQRDYNYFYCIIETRFLRLLIGSAPRRDIREIFLFHEIYTQHSHIKAR